jgi:dihydropyrimidinase
MQHGSDYTSYEDMEVTGRPAGTLPRGQLVADNDQIIGAPGYGRFLPRETIRGPQPEAWQ